MPRFFVDKKNILADSVIIGGEDAKHISLSLRAKIGEKISVCDGEGRDYDCEITSITKDEVRLGILNELPSETEPDVEVVLYQALVKSDKFDFIVQKCTELGVSRIVPTVTERCVSRPDESSLSKKTARWNKIAKEAAMQSGRGRIPVVEHACSFEEALEGLKNADIGFLCYEKTPHESIDEIYGRKKCERVKRIAFIVGPEGGISDNEADKTRCADIPFASLGPRILRAETAPLCVMSVLMMLTDNME